MLSSLHCGINSILFTLLLIKPKSIIIIADFHMALLFMLGLKKCWCFSIFKNIISCHRRNSFYHHHLSVLLWSIFKITIGLDFDALIKCLFNIDQKNPTWCKHTANEMYSREANFICRQCCYFFFFWQRIKNQKVFYYLCIFWASVLIGTHIDGDCEKCLKKHIGETSRNLKNHHPLYQFHVWL